MDLPYDLMFTYVLMNLKSETLLHNEWSQTYMYAAEILFRLCNWKQWENFFLTLDFTMPTPDNEIGADVKWLQNYFQRKAIKQPTQKGGLYMIVCTNNMKVKISKLVFCQNELNFCHPDLYWQGYLCNLINISVATQLTWREDKASFSSRSILNTSHWLTQCK